MVEIFSFSGAACGAPSAVIQASTSELIRHGITGFAGTRGRSAALANNLYLPPATVVKRGKIDSALAKMQAPGAIPPLSGLLVKPRL